MTGRGRELAELMRIQRVDIFCVQETRRKGNKTKELGDGYKLINSGANEQGRNGFGVLLSREMKNAATELVKANVSPEAIMASRYRPIQQRCQPQEQPQVNCLSVLCRSLGSFPPDELFPSQTKGG
ncbi:uncharacterized protein LOC135223333 [Macrobrachium nipponense]|uniref:uncharacterized protein LOC135223333 n=1 Tax=Macrobrachium nipponense TaxID=159736 RepID=UPI0030C8009C